MALDWEVDCSDEEIEKAFENNCSGECIQLLLFICYLL